MNEWGFGEKLKELRQRAGKSQEEVVKELTEMFYGQAHISQSTLSALEQRRTAPREAVLQVLAEYYDVPITYFFDKSDPSPNVGRQGIDLAKDYLRSLPNRRISNDAALRTHKHHPASQLDDDDF